MEKDNSKKLDDEFEKKLEEFSNLVDEFWKLAKEYEERFGEFFGTYEWYPFGLRKAVELLKRCLERGSPVTLEEYYIELVGLSEEELRLLREGKIKF